jgi:hypothetical protein
MTTLEALSEFRAQFMAEVVQSLGRLKISGAIIVAEDGAVLLTCGTLTRRLVTLEVVLRSPGREESTFLVAATEDPMRGWVLYPSGGTLVIDIAKELLK